MKRYLLVLFVAIVTIFTQCETIQNLPTNTSGGLFSLNGSWRLETTSDNQSMVGTVIQVFPAVTDATIRTLANNNYCLRERDIFWRNLKAQQGGAFSLETIVNACSGAAAYNAGTLTALTSDEVRVNSRTANNTELIQTWRRVPNQ